jgi:tetratricopeptide (TPR) repeat protein
MNTPAATAVVPFWHRLGEISKYPLQSGAITNVLLFTVLRIADLLPLGIAGLIVSAVLWAGILKYAAEVLVQTAHGRLDAPEYSMQVGESQAWDQIKLQILLWLMMFVGMLAIGAVAGPGPAMLWLLFVAIAIPGATITLAMTNNLWAALNPAGWIELMSAFGWPYFVVAALCALYQVSGANAQAFAEAIPFVPHFVTHLFTWFITHYVLVATFHLMGYLVYQYADRIGHEVKRDEAPAKLRQRHQDPDQGLVDEAEALVQDGRADEAATRLAEHIVTRGGTVLVHEHYRKLLKATQDPAGLLKHGLGYAQVLLAQDNLKRALELMQECYALDPNFAPDIADDVHRLAQRASQTGLHPLALKLVSGFHKRWPKHKDIARNYLFAAKVMTDKLNREEQALQLLTQLKAFRPDDALMPEIDAQIQLLQSLVRSAKPV